MKWKAPTVLNEMAVDTPLLCHACFWKSGTSKKASTGSSRVRKWKNVFAATFCGTSYSIRSAGMPTSFLSELTLIGRTDWHAGECNIVAFAL